MLKNLDEIVSEALKLDMQERAELLQRLILSLETSTESEIERLWVVEAERRLQEFREGRKPGIPADEAFRRIINEIS